MPARVLTTDRNPDAGHSHRRWRPRIKNKEDKHGQEPRSGACGVWAVLVVGVWNVARVWWCVCVAGGLDGPMHNICECESENYVTQRPFCVGTPRSTARVRGRFLGVQNFVSRPCACARGVHSRFVARGLRVRARFHFPLVTSTTKKNCASCPRQAGFQLNFWLPLRRQGTGTGRGGCGPVWTTTTGPVGAVAGAWGVMP